MESSLLLKLSSVFLRWLILFFASFALFFLCAAISVFPQEPNAPNRHSPKVSGKVTNAQGDPLEGVEVELCPAGSVPSASLLLSKTDALGEYSIQAKVPGTYAVRFQLQGFRPRNFDAISLQADEAKRLDVTLEILPGKSVPASPPANQGLEFSDAPNFTVAGVTDRSNMGLHGSDANVRTSDVLAKETATLKPGAAEKTATSGVGDAHRLAGDAKEKSGDPVGAEKEYEAAAKLDPSEENYFAWGAELLLHRAGPATVQVFAKGAELHPLSERLRAGLAAAYYADGQYSEAALEMCHASDLNPGDTQPYLFLGRMEKAAAEPLPCSEDHLKRFADEKPGEALAHYYYALVLWKKSRKVQDTSGVNQTEQHLLRAAELDPSLAEVYIQLGLLYNARGQKEAALTQFQKAVAAQPDLSAAHYQLSLACRRAGDAAKADDEMTIYERLRRSEDAQLEKERHELRQFVTILKDKPSPAPH